MNARLSQPERTMIRWMLGAREGHGYFIAARSPSDPYSIFRTLSAETVHG